jgi:hypothetical protein
MPIVDKATGSASLLEKKLCFAYEQFSSNYDFGNRSFSFCLEIMNLTPPTISLNLKDETNRTVV